MVLKVTMPAVSQSLHALQLSNIFLMAVWVTQSHASGWAKVFSLELMPVLG